MKTFGALIWILVLIVVSTGRSVGQSPESGYVEVDGGRVFYETAGQGPIIVMTHDGTLHRETWDAQFAEFAKHYRVIRWDRRGYGRSDAPTKLYSDLDDQRALFAALKIDRAILLGCSAGGQLSIHFALEYPDKVSALVLVGPIVSGLPYSDHFMKRGGRSFPAGDVTLAQKIDYWVNDPWLVAQRSVAAKEKLKSLLEANPQNLNLPTRFVRWLAPPALPRLSQIKVPTLIVVGENDIPDVHAHVGAIQAGIAGSKRVVLWQSGHLVHLEVPSEFNRVTLEFLTSIK